MSTDVVALEWNRPIRLLAEGHAAISFGGTYEVQALGEALGVTHGELWQDFGFMGCRPARVERARAWRGR